MLAFVKCFSDFYKIYFARHAGVSLQTVRLLSFQNATKGSMSAPGCPYDNSCVESFFATLKKELIFRRQYATIEEVKTDLYRYIELFYNRKRLHSTLG